MEADKSLGDKPCLHTVARGGETMMHKMTIGKTVVRVYDRSGIILLSPEEQRLEFSRRLEAQDKVAMGILHAMVEAALANEQSAEEA